jgi:inner membrane protein
MLFSIVFVGFFGTLNYVSLLDGAPSVPLLLITLITGYFFFRRVWNYWRKPTIEIDMSNTSIKDWSILFGLGFLTHTLLDACTPFGTQLFQPFSNVRISFDTIAVIDPLYTVPFLICLILAAFYHRASSRRRFFNWLGIGLSCAYLAFTFYNQHQMENKFKALLEERNVNYNQVSVVPTIFNNALWQCVAETDTNYVFTNYSVFDKNLDKIKLVSIEKNHDLLAAYESDKEIKILKWFSKGYYNVEQQADGSLKYNDLKIAVISEDIFGELYFGMNYTISEAGSGIVISENREIEFPEGMFQRFWTRIKGYK